MCCSSEEVHPFIWTKPIISQHKYDSRKLSASLVSAACLGWYTGDLGDQRGAVFSLPLKEMTVASILTPPNFAALEAENVNIRKQVSMPRGVRDIQALFLLPMVPAPEAQGLRAGQDFTFIW